jgi:tRNA A-37 threonylcarbamoyl transferase component Bud32
LTSEAAGGGLDGAPEALEALARAGIVTVGDLVSRARCVRSLPDRENLVLELAGRRAFVKRGRRARVGPPAELEGLRAAEAAGVPVPRVLAHGRDAARGEVVATEDLAPARPLDEVLRAGLLPPAGLRQLWADLAHAVARLHDAGIHHRDLYLNHVFVDPARAHPLVAVIDWDRAARHRRRLGRRVVKDLAALEASAAALVSPAARLRFLARYAAHRGLARAASRRLLGRVVRKARRIQRHVPRTPVGEAARPGTRAWPA